MGGARCAARASRADAAAALVVLGEEAELDVVVERDGLGLVEGVVHDAEDPLGRRRVWRVREHGAEREA